MTSPAAADHDRHDRHVTAWLLFAGLFACYFTLHPGSMVGQGYTDEEITSGVRILDVVDAWWHGRAVPFWQWSRQGSLPVLFDLPFIAAGRSLVSVEFGVSMQPILLTAAILAVLYLWLRAVATPAVSLLLTIVFAFGTMFWPYAYIGLETKQTFALTVAGYLALSGRPVRSWPRILALAFASALAVSLKSTGLTLVPAVLYLVYVQFRTDWRRHVSVLGVILGTIALIFVAAAHGRDLYWRPLGGLFNSLLGLFLIGSTVDLFTNVIGIFGSPTKGLFVYAPVLLAMIYAVPVAFRRHRDITIFALLVTAGTVAFASVLRFPADEVWGSRYLHVAMAPLAVVIGAAWPAFDWKRHLPIAALGAIGVPVAFLGAFFYYGNLVAAGAAAGQNTMEWMTGDHVWNPIRTGRQALYRAGTKAGPSP